MTTQCDGGACSNLLDQLLSAASSGNDAAIRRLKRADTLPINGIGEDGKTALMCGVIHGHVECVHSLVSDNRTSVDKQDETGRTALIYAAQHNQAKIITELLDRAQADPIIRNNEGMTCLLLAAMNGYHECVQSMIHKVNINECDEDGKTAIMYAAQNGHRQVCELLINHSQQCCNETRAHEVQTGHDQCMSVLHRVPSLNLNDSDKDGNTALMLAAMSGETDCLKFLSDTDLFNMNSRDCKQRTALMLAARNNRSECIEYLVSKEAVDVNAQDETGQTALMIAARYGYMNCMVYLLNKPRVDVNCQDLDKRTALMYLCTHATEDHRDCLDYIIRNKSSELEFNIGDENEHTALILAIDKGHSEGVKLLLETGKVDANKLDCRQNTALMIATLSGETNCMEHLSSYLGGSVNEQEIDGYTALMLASFKGFDQWVEYLLNIEEIDANLCSTEGVTALMLAAMAGHKNCVRILLMKAVILNIDLNKEDDDGFTALMRAAEYGHIDCVELLIEQQNINVNHPHPDKAGKTALMIATEKKETECVRALIRSKDINVNATDEKGTTALMLAAKGGVTECMKVLLGAKKIEIYQQDHLGNTAFMLASKNGHVESVKCLASHNGKYIGAQYLNKKGRDAFLLSAMYGCHKVLRCFLDISVKGEIPLYNNESITEDSTTSIFMQKYPVGRFQYNSGISWNRPFIYGRQKQGISTLNLFIGFACSFGNCIPCFLIGESGIPDDEKICCLNNSLVKNPWFNVSDSKMNTDLMLATMKVSDNSNKSLEYLIQFERIRLHTLVFLIKEDLNKSRTVSIVFYKKLSYFIWDESSVDHALDMIYRGVQPGKCVDYLLSAYILQTNKFNSSALSNAVFQEHKHQLELLIDHVCYDHKRSDHLKAIFLTAATKLKVLSYLPLFLKHGIFQWSWYPEFPPQRLRLLVRELVIHGYVPEQFNWQGQLSYPLHHAFIIGDCGLIHYLVANLYLMPEDLKRFQNDTKLKEYVQSNFTKSEGIELLHQQLFSQPWRMEAISLLKVSSLLRNEIREQGSIPLPSLQPDNTNLTCPPQCKKVKYSPSQNNHILESKQCFESRLLYMNPIRWLCVDEWLHIIPSFVLYGGPFPRFETKFRKCCNGKCCEIKKIQA